MRTIRPYTYSLVDNVQGCSKQVDRLDNVQGSWGSRGLPTKINPLVWGPHSSLSMSPRGSCYTCDHWAFKKTCSGLGPVRWHEPTTFQPISRCAIGAGKTILPICWISSLNHCTGSTHWIATGARILKCDKCNKWQIKVFWYFLLYLKISISLFYP